MTEIHTPENEARIERLYAFLSVDAEGRNGVVGHILPLIGAAPLVTGKRSIADKMIPIAETVAKETGAKIGLYVFKRVEGEELWQSE